VGDRVTYNGQFGAIVFVADTGEFSPGFLKEHWSDVQHGFMIRFDNGALLQLDEADDHLLRVAA
jgi:hypothetical protein